MKNTCGDHQTIYPLGKHVCETMVPDGSYHTSIINPLVGKMWVSIEEELKTKQGDNRRE
jgi:hypothetical protein